MAKTTNGARWRATLEDVIATTDGAGLTQRRRFNTVAALTRHLKTNGPILLRFRWYDRTEPDPRNATIAVEGTKGSRVTVAIVGYDEAWSHPTDAARQIAKAHPFRILTAFGSGWGQAGRAWLSSASLARILKDGASAIGVKG